MFAENLFHYPIIEFVKHEDVYNDKTGTFTHSKRVVYAKWFKDRQVTEIVLPLTDADLRYISEYIVRNRKQATKIANLVEPLKIAV